MAAPIYMVQTNGAESTPFSTPSPAFIVCGLFNDDLSDQCELIRHCSFDLNFANNSNV